MLYIQNEIRNLRRANMPKDERFRLEKEDSREDRELRGYVVASIAQSVVHNLRPVDPATMHNPNPPRPQEDQKLPAEQPGRQSGAQEWTIARGEAGPRLPPRDPHQRGIWRMSHGTSVHLINHRPDKVEVTSGHVLEPAIMAKTWSAESTRPVPTLRDWYIYTYMLIHERIPQQNDLFLNTNCRPPSIPPKIIIICLYWQACTL
jgi:hypothetical protein